MKIRGCTRACSRSWTPAGSGAGTGAGNNATTTLIGGGWDCLGWQAFSV